MPAPEKGKAAPPDPPPAPFATGQTPPPPPSPAPPPPNPTPEPLCRTGHPPPLEEISDEAPSAEGTGSEAVVDVTAVLADPPANQDDHRDGGGGSLDAFAAAVGAGGATEGGIMVSRERYC